MGSLRPREPVSSGQSAVEEPDFSALTARFVEACAGSDAAECTRAYQAVSAHPQLILGAHSYLTRLWSNALERMTIDLLQERIGGQR